MATLPATIGGDLVSTRGRIDADRAALVVTILMGPIRASRGVAAAIIPNRFHNLIVLKQRRQYPCHLLVIAADLGENRLAALSVRRTANERIYVREQLAV